MHSFRTDSQFFRDALERAGKADDVRTARLTTQVNAERRETEQTGAKALLSEWQGLEPTRVIGHLAALNGTQGVISCPLKLDEEEWSVGHLITIAHRSARLVGTVCDVATDDGRWSENETNAGRVTIEWNGEIAADPDGAPFSIAACARFPRLARPRIASAQTISEPSIRFAVGRGSKSAG